MATQMIERPVRRPAADLEAFSHGRFLSVTSFKRDGTAVATPVWSVSDGERLFALTDRGSAKVRRIRRNPRVVVAPCRASGALRGEPVAAWAEVQSTKPELERVQRLLLDRYPVSYRLVMLLYRVGRRLRGRSGVGDGAALTITIGGGPTVPDPCVDDESHTPPHGDALLTGGPPSAR
jgi:hypothetical protein